MTNWEKLIEGHGGHKLLWRDISAFQLPQDYFTTLKIWCKEEKERGEGFNTILVGHLKEEYRIRNFSEDFERYIINCSLQQPVYSTWQGLSIISENKPIYLDKLWVNYQKKYEFNPPHDHSGFVSFVIFVKIPYNCEDYKTKFPKTKPENIKVGMLSFQHIDPWVGRPMSIDISLNPNYEGGIYFFKSKHVHQVYPFYDTDEYRVTVSGNIHLL